MTDDETRDDLALKQYPSEFTPVGEMTTTELLAHDAKVGNFLDKANTLDGRVYVAAVRARRREIREELSRRHEDANAEAFTNFYEDR